VIRPRDPLWDTLVDELGDVATKDERGIRNRALKQLREIGATPEDIRRRCHAYRVQWPKVSLTASALVKHWSALKAPPARDTTPITEVLNLPDISEAERKANLERARALSEAIGREL